MNTQTQPVIGSSTFSSQMAHDLGSIDYLECRARSGEDYVGELFGVHVNIPRRELCGYCDVESNLGPVNEYLYSKAGVTVLVREGALCDQLFLLDEASLAKFRALRGAALMERED